MTTATRPAGTTTGTLFTRPGEVLMEIASPDAGVCAATGKPLAAGLFAWDHRISSGPQYDRRPWTLGEDAFPSVRHTDGTDCPSWGRFHTGCTAKPRCAGCGAHDSLTTTHETWDDVTTCGACGHTVRRPTGD
ncbi:hypothetical protein [Saccharothrix sp. HUAS TT1]|uniref:hypothetical protein n=1 Tax=unclassified Saccharothrix TaxID=2593673 RepID=UPI00345C228C